jgi:hypothetical protein
VKQPNLDIGQKDFKLSTCKDCGMAYQAFNEADRRAHLKMHKPYIEGIEINPDAKVIIFILSSFSVSMALSL